MKKFEIGKVYSITQMGHKGTNYASTVRVIKKTDKFVTFLNCGCERNGFLDELEKVKIRYSDNGNEWAIIFGGLVSDSVFSTDLFDDRIFNNKK